MISILNQYIENDILITEYTKDGKTVSHIVKTCVSENEEQPIESQPTLEEIQAQILLNTEYLVVMSEINSGE